MEELIHGLQRLVWGPGMLVFFLGTGIRFTIRSKFFRSEKYNIWMGKTLGAIKNGEKDRKGAFHSFQFQSFCTALAATLGTGKHYRSGYSTDLLGGPGAVFWMWVSAFFG